MCMPVYAGMHLCLYPIKGIRKGMYIHKLIIKGPNKHNIYIYIYRWTQVHLLFRDSLHAEEGDGQDEVGHDVEDQIPLEY